MKQSGILSICLVIFVFLVSTHNICVSAEAKPRKPTQVEKDCSSTSQMVKRKLADTQKADSSPTQSQDTEMENKVDEESLPVSKPETATVPIELVTVPRFSTTLTIGANVISVAIASLGISANRPAFIAGIRGDYRIGEKTAMFLGSEFLSRGARLVSLQWATATFLDFPLGLKFQIGQLSPSRAIIDLLMGGYLSFALNDLVYNGTVIQKTKPSAGAYARVELNHPIGRTTYVGVTSWLKTGILKSYTASIYGDLGQIMEAGIGATLRF